MKFNGICVLVEDMERAKRFYTEIMGQKIVVDMGRNVVFEGGYALQSDYETLMHIPKNTVVQNSNSFELYFETEDINGELARLEAAGVKFLHKLIEAPWAQLGVKLYDPDGHIVEVGESMHALVVRLMAGGMDEAAVSQRTGLPPEAVKGLLQGNAPA